MRKNSFGWPKPHQALFDLKNDPDQVNNLAQSNEHKETLERMALQLLKWQKVNKDAGVIPEIALNRFAENTLIYELKDESLFQSLRNPATPAVPTICCLRPD